MIAGMSFGSALGYLGFGGIVALTIVLGVFTVEQQTVAIVERFGKFLRIARPGLNFKLPWVDWVAGRETLRIQQLDVEVETKTKDNVFVKVDVAVQFFVMPDKAFEAFYKLEDAEEQISAYVFDVVRARVPTLLLDDVFAKKDDIASAVKDELAQTMDDFGYGITKALVTDIDPDETVKASMNAINAAQRNRVAALEQGEANKTLQVKNAEAEAESKALQGAGIARQRQAIILGLQESVKDFSAAVGGVGANDVMQLVMMTQYFDTLKEIGAASNTIMLPHSPGGLADIGAQIRDGMLAATAASK